MSIIDVSVSFWQFNRERTLGKLAEIEKLPDPVKTLGWRPGPGRAPIAWQLMHIGVTEELFATERLVGTTPEFADLVARFRGGSTPDDDTPSPDRIRHVLETTRGHLLATVGKLREEDLGTIPPAFRERGWSIRQILQVISWHEAHHQGQAHITLNLWKAAQG